MNSPKLFALALSAWICISPTQAGELYAFNGTCRNATAGVDGNVKLVFWENTNKIEGFMSVSGWLIGGGDVNGIREGNTFRFMSADPSSRLMIYWQGTLQDAILSGEFLITAKAGAARQVGEWRVENVARALVGASTQNEKMTAETMKLVVELKLNEPVKQSDGKVITGAENIFKAAHPAGTGLSICVENLDIEWKPESQTRTLEDIYKYRATYVLYWQGIVTPKGWTRLRLAYNSKINAITSHEIIESTGTTNQQFNELVFGIGALLGKAAVNRMFDGK
jgi:hypothetical protein